MKLFLTATSERGKPITKSGNDWIKIEVVDENREVIFTRTFNHKCMDCGITLQLPEEIGDGKCLQCENN